MLSMEGDMVPLPVGEDDIAFFLALLAHEMIIMR